MIAFICGFVAFLLMCAHVAVTYINLVTVGKALEDGADNATLSVSYQRVMIGALLALFWLLVCHHFTG